MEVFKQMIAAMSIKELNEHSALIEKGIVKYIDAYAHRRDVEDWMEQVKLIAEELQRRRQQRIEFNEAA